MSIEATLAGAAMAALPQTQQAGYGASMTDALQFNQALGAASGSAAAGPVENGGLDAIGPAVKGMMQALEGVNGQAAALGQYAKVAEAKGAQLTPGEMIMLTVRCHEFLFQSQLTSNIANRTSDGLQQLFRQQS
jgi:hypothetical protein